MFDILRMSAPSLDADQAGGSQAKQEKIDSLPLEQITAAGVVTYYCQDQLGSTRALTNTWIGC